MKLIIAGGRDLKVTMNLLRGIMVAYDIDLASIKEIVCGEASGVDAAGKGFALGFNIPVKSFPYKSELGKAGGPVRNREMAQYGDALLLIWNCHSRGSASMKTEALKEGLPIWEVILANPPAKKLLKENGLSVLRK